jgi:hypothetical protein
MALKHNAHYGFDKLSPNGRVFVSSIKPKELCT